MKWNKVVTNIHGIYRNNRQTLWKSENLLKSMQEVARPGGRTYPAEEITGGNHHQREGQ